MARSWDSVSSLPSFTTLEYDQKEQVRDQFFQEEIAPQIPQESLASVRQLFDEDTAIENPDQQGFIGDTASLLNVGFQSMGIAGREIASRVLPDSWVSAIDSIDASLNDGVGGKDLMESNIESSMSKLSPEMSAAMKKDWVSEKDDEFFGDAVSDPRAYWGSIMQSLPETAATMLPSTMIGKAIYTAQIAKGATKAVAAAKAGTAAQISGSLMEGALGGAHSADDVRDTVLSMPDETLLNSEAIKSLMSSGLSLGDAKTRLADDTATQAFVTAGVATGAFGGWADRLLTKGITGGIKGGLAKRMAKGAITEGVLEEFPQSYFSKVAENLALQRADPSIETTSGALNEAVGGMAAGGIMGAGFGAFTSNQPQEELPPTDGAPYSPTANVPGGPAVPPEVTPQEDVAPDTTTISPDLIAEGNEALAEKPAPVSERVRQILAGIPKTQAQRMAGISLDAREVEQAQQKEADYNKIVEESRLPAAMYDVEVDKAAGAFTERPTAMQEALTKALGRELTVAEKMKAKKPAGKIETASLEAATHPENVLPEPTEAQKEAGNYKKGHLTINGLGISIENPKGSTRTGTDESGNNWSTTMKNTYGYFKRSDGADGDNVDVFMSENAEDPALPVFIVDQVDPKTRKFDEHKVMMGFPDEAAARAGYLENYQKDWNGIGGVKQLSQDEFKSWLQNEDTTKPATSVIRPVASIAKPKAPKPMAPDTAKDSLLVAISKMGGIDRTEAEAQGVDPANWKGSQGNRPTWRKDGGHSLDAMAEKLSQYGYFPEGVEYGPNALLDLIDRELGGDKVYTPAGIEAAAEIAHQERMTEEDQRNIEAMAEEAALYPGLLDSLEAIENTPPNSEIYTDEEIDTIIQQASESEAARAERLAEIAAATEEGSSPTPSGTIIEGKDLLGQDVSKAQALEDLKKAKDEKTSGKADVPVSAGEFFGMGGKLEPDLFDQAPKKEPVIKQMKAKKAKKDYGSKNKVFKESDAEKARALLKKKLGQLQSGVDPEVLQAGITLAGYHIEAGARSIGDFTKAMVADLGDAVKPYLKSWYMGVKYDPRASELDGMSSAADVESYNVEKEITDVTEQRSDEDLERDRAESKAQDKVGDERIRAESGRDDGASKPREQRPSKEGDIDTSNIGLSDHEAAANGERGDFSPYSEDEQPGIESSIAGSDYGERGGIVGNQGSLIDFPAAETVGDDAKRGFELKRKRGAQKVAQSVKVNLTDKANIKESLPFLQNNQMSDVEFAETRFAKPDGYGVLFTNGTGTGKTYTGLGIVKRFERQGKKNVLIVVPDDKILNDWIDSGKNLLLDITQLKDIKDKGHGITITTYSNLGQNDELAKRDWDLIVADEAHNLKQSKDGKDTRSLLALRAISNHPGGKYTKHSMLYRKELEEIQQLRDKINANNDIIRLDDTRGEQRIELQKENEKLEARDKELNKKLEGTRNKVYDKVDQAQGAGRTRVAFMSATPFAYEKTVDYAEGYLFNYPVTEDQSYNSGGGYEKFMMEHFGYSMRYNKLTEPGIEVNRGIMQRQFNSFLKKEKVLSGRMLDVDYDYDRKFILTENAIGVKIDEGLQFLFDSDRYSPLSSIVREEFDHLSRRYLLEAIKTRESIPLIKDHLALDRKVVVFHDYKKGGGFNPFNLRHLQYSDANVEIKSGIKGKESVKLGTIVRDFMAERPDLANLDLSGLKSPIEEFTAQFTNLLIVNGNKSNKENIKSYIDFNDDEKGPQVLLIQSAKNSGWSGHDTTGKYQRVLFNLGLPTRPTMSIQQEGRIFRVGQKSNALFRYLNTGTNWERFAFATTIAQRSSAAENLALGEEARALMDTFIESFEASDSYPAGHPGEGTGGKERDRAANAALTDWDRAMTLYFSQQKKTAKTKAKEGKDYFATPEPLGMKMVEWANTRDKESILEPSAGHGAIARWFPEHISRTAIEPSSELASRLKMVTDAKLLQERFEDFNIVNKFDAVVMNPPFGSGGSDAVKHLDKAASHLRDGGRIVAIIPKGPAADKKFDKWLYGDRAADKKAKDRTVVDELYLVADIALPSVTFERAGTKVMARVVIIDRVSNKEQAANLEKVTRDYTGDSKIGDFFDSIEMAEMPDRIEVTAPVKAQPKTVAAEVEGFAMAEMKHTKTGADIYVATLESRVEREEYKRLNAIAKQNKGRYSAYKAQGAIPGFHFKTDADRQSFVEAAGIEAPKFSRAEKKITQDDVDILEKSIINDLGLKTLMLSLDRNGKDIKVIMIEVPPGSRKQGTGTEAMRRIADYADTNGLRVLLSPGQPDDRHGTTSRARLVKFYKRFGFVENKGRNKDFKISEGMFREPLENEGLKFSRGTSAPSSLGFDAVKATVDAIVAKAWFTGVDVNIHKTESALPAAILEQARKEGALGEIIAVHHKDSIHIVADRITSIAEAEKAIFHEAAHYGGAALYGSGRNKAYKSLFMKLGGTAGVTDLAESLGFSMDQYVKTARQLVASGKMSSDQLAVYLADEFLAHKNAMRGGEALPAKILRLIKEFYGKIRDMLRASGYVELPKVNDSDLSLLLKTINESVRSKAKTDTTPMFMTTEVRGPMPMFYSQMQRVLEDKLPGKGAAEQFKSTIESFAKKGQFKAEELEWSGVTEWLADQDGAITKAQVIDFLAANEIQIEEVEKREGDFAELREVEQFRRDMEEKHGTSYSYEWPIADKTKLAKLQESADSPSTPAKYAGQQLPGGENYRELLLTLPGKEIIGDEYSVEGTDISWPGEPEKIVYDVVKKDGTTVVHHRATREEAESTARRMNTTATETYKSVHYDEPNILAHVRFNERTDADGKRVLFIEEVQSDWHQAGRKRGYQDPKIVDELKSKYKYLPADHTNWSLGMLESAGVPVEDQQRWFDSSIKAAGVPNAPFKTTWPMLAMKRMIRYASENGFDSIAWTTGEQQNDRYDLSKQVDSITWYATPDGKYNISFKKDGRSQLAKAGVAEKDLESIVGKELALKIVEEAQNEVTGEFAGQDLKVGGSGMTGFYDKILPSAVNKYVKKWGAHVGEAEIVTQEAEGMRPSPDGDVDVQEITEPVHALQITDAMRDAAMGGQPLFARKPVTQSEFAAENSRLISKFESEGWSLEKATQMAKSELKKTNRVARKPQKSKIIGNFTPEERAVIEAGGFGTRGKKSIKEASKEIFDRFGTKMRQGIVDQYASIKDVLGDDRAWMMAHLSHASAGGLEALMQYGKPRLTDGALDVDVESDSLQEILEPLGGDLDRFFMWMAGNRAAKLKAEDRERLFSDVDIEVLQGMDKTSTVGPEVFEAVRVEFEAMGDAVNKIAVETGLISAEEADAWQEDSFYVPFYRMLEGESKGPRVFANQLTKQTAYKKLKGADLQLDDILTNVLMNWNHLLSASMKNQAGVRAANSAVDMGLGEWVTQQTKSKDAIWLRKEGRQVWFDVEKSTDGALVMDTLVSLNYDGLNTLSMKMMRKFKRALTIGVTLNPEFRIANLLRDTLHSIAVVGDEGMSTNVVKNVFNGWKDTKKGSPIHARMIASGGAFGDSGYIHGADPEAIKHIVTKGISRNTVLDARWKIRKVFDMYQDFGARMENINRAASFEHELKKGDFLKAAFSSRDLLDFSRTGGFPAVRFLTSVIPFMNARLQGLDKMGRAAMAKGERKRFLTVVGMYSLASVAIYLMMKDDEDFKEAEEWEKDAYHLFKVPGSDVLFRFPRPFEVGAIGNMAERAVEQMVDDEVHGELFAERLGHALTQTFAFNPLPQNWQIIKPLTEIYSNKNTFTGRPIESRSMSSLPAKDRKRAWTSETAIAFSSGMDKVSWGKVVLSPVQVEHLVSGYLGWAGAQALAATDTLITRPTIGSPDKPSKKATEYPVLNRFMREAPSRNTKYTTRFYEDLSEINEAYSSVRQSRLVGDSKAYRAKVKEKKPLLKWRSQYLFSQKQLSNINKRIDSIYRSDRNADVKRVEIDKLIVKKNKITKRMVEKSKL